MYNKKIMCTTVAGIMALGMIPQCTHASTNNEIINKLEYQKSSESAKIVSAKDSNGVIWFYEYGGRRPVLYGTNSSASAVTVPESIDGVRVAYIENISVDGSNSKIKKVIINAVAGISQTAFDDCPNLEDIEISNDCLNNIDLTYLRQHKPNVKINGSPISTQGSVGKQSGWVESNGKRYYFYTESGIMAIGFIKLGNVHYYLDEAQNNLGNLVTGWKKINGSWYYFSPTPAQNKEKGYMMTGWYGNYYFYGSGKMATGFINLNGSYYYLDESNTSSVGLRKTGWQKIQGSWYYFAKPGEAQYTGLMTKGWKQIGGVWYYFYSNGKMACNTTINGYRLNASGAWVR